MLQLGVVDDLAVLAETDIKKKDLIAKRKSIYSQLQGQLQQMQEAIKDKDGTIETLERQLVQAGIKGKVMQAEMEINKQKEEIKGETKDAYRQTQAEQAVIQGALGSEANVISKEMKMEAQKAQNDLQNNNNNS